MSNHVLVADPPWMIGRGFPTGAAANHYPLMTDKDILSFPLPPMEKDALLFLWRLASRPQISLDVVKAWGFEIKSEIIWVKTTKPYAKPMEGMLPSARLAFGQGHYTRASHEVCLIANRGRSLIKNHSLRSVIVAPRGHHSAKPDEFYEMVEKMCDGPYAELFARRQRPGWQCFGNELVSISA